MGRVVDPMAREDGVDEPEIELGSAAADSAGSPIERADGSDDQDAVTASRPSSHPVRDRLLAKAAQARRSVDSEAEATQERSELRSISDELDLIAGPSVSKRSAPLQFGGSPLSANAVAIFGTLIGLAVVATLFAVLIRVAPRGVEVEPTLKPAPSAAPSVAAQPPAAPRPERKKIPGPWRIDDAADQPDLKLIKGSIGKEPFLRAVQEAGLERDQAYRVLTALKGERNLDRCNPSDEFMALVRRDSKRVVAFEYIVSKEEIYQAREGNDGLLSGKRLDLKVMRERVQGAFVYDGKFDESARRAGFESGLSTVVARALDGRTNVAQFKPGDILRVVALEVTVLGEFSRYDGIEALEYRPVDGDPLRLYYFHAGNRRGYYDARGRAPGEGGWRKPIKGAPITSRFNPKRMHPILKKIMPHTGTDFGAPAGTPVRAAYYGTVTFVGYAGANGNFVRIEHPAGYSSGYSHLSRFESGLKVGDKVKTLQPIGYVGSTGRSTGPHLHFSVKKDGKYIDAESLKLDSLSVLPKKERALLAEVRQKYDALLDAIALPPVPPHLQQALAAPGADEASEDSMGTEEADENETAGATSVAATTATVAAPAAKAPAPAAKPTAAAKGPSTPPATSNALYLTDRELMLAQPSQDDGEVEE